MAYGCKTPTSNTEVDSHVGLSDTIAGFVQVPHGWRVAQEQHNENLYQAQLTSADDTSRILIGQIPLDVSTVDDTSLYLSNLHNLLVERIRGESGAYTFTEESISWANGVEGLRTLLKGESGAEPIIIEGMTFMTSDAVYFIYGRFLEEHYQEARTSYQAVIASAKPLQGKAPPTKDRTDVALSTVPETQPPKETPDQAPTPTEFTIFNAPSTQIAGFSWGTPRDEIKQSQGEPARATPQLIAYQASMEGIPGALVYHFTFEKLTQVMFVFHNTHEDARSYLDDFIRIDKSITANYGEPLQRATIWSNDRHKSDQTMWADAVILGDVVFGSVWTMGDAKVIHSLKSDGAGGIHHRIVYKNKKIQENIAR